MHLIRHHKRLFTPTTHRGQVIPSVRRIGLVSLRSLAFKRAYGGFGHPIWDVYFAEHVVIGPANHAYSWGGI
ncbi:MAG: hypothetical protein FJ083_09140 [Cyanobacteria bacterium K_Offshore_surface_m2_239]|nr:hypothetical protein [Cyanobacteria bacterium K_Offshore_surface_m2_239]